MQIFANEKEKKKKIIVKGSWQILYSYIIKGKYEEKK